MKTKILIIFFTVSIGELLSIALDLEKWQLVFKPLLMITLGVYYYLSTYKNLTTSKLIISAILFSFIGDVCLMFQGENKNYFMAGLGAFLLAHISYIMAYNQHKEEKGGEGLNGIQKFRFALPIILAGTGLITILYAHLGALKIPVSLYALVIMVMVLQALFRYGHTNQKSFWLVLVGAMLFMISDGMIAINKFLASFQLAGIGIMITYISGQFLIIQGLIFYHHGSMKK